MSSDSASEAAPGTALEDRDDRLRVTLVGSGATAIERLQSDQFDCVVSEYRLPEQNGIDLLETVREQYPSLPFVLCVADGDEEIAAAAISAGVTEYLPRDPATDDGAALADTIVDAVDGSEGTLNTAGGSRRLEQVLTTIPQCVVQFDTDGQFIYANQRAKEVLGLEQTAVVGRGYNDPEWEIRDTDGEPIPDEQLPYRQVLDSGEPVYDYRHSIRWPDGSEKVLSVSGAPLFDAGGDVESVVFSLQNITERTQRQRELQRYQQIVDHLDDIATIIQPDGTVTYVSPAVERVLGYDPDELIGEVGFGYQPPAGEEAVAEAIDQVLADPTEPQTVQTRFRRADGSWVWIESTLRNRLGDDVIDGILVSSRDIGERREQKERLQHREQQVSQLHAATRDLLTCQTEQDVAETASQTAVDVLGFRLNGIHFYDETADGLAPVAVSDGSRDLFGDVPVLDEGVAWTAYTQGESKVYNDIDDADRVYNPQSPAQSEIHLPLGEYGVFIISSTDRGAFEEPDIELARILAANTEAALDRISYEQKLRDRETALETQNERLEEFAGIVSHDLRNPLNVAQTRTELLARERESEHLRPLEDALDRMEEIVLDTLTLAREGRTVAETEPIRLSSLIDQCWQTVSTADATITVVDDVTISGDRSRLHHVFENLFRNSVEHGGADLTVRVGRLGDTGIYVEDTGPGIPDSDHEAVFEPGYTSEADGTGFGLTIVKRIAEAHGWQVALTAGSAGGARFEFTGVEIPAD